MRIAIPALALLAATLFMVGRLSGGGGDSACANFVYWHGSRYRGNSVKADLRVASRPIGIGRTPRCIDNGDVQPARRGIKV